MTLISVFITFLAANPGWSMTDQEFRTKAEQLSRAQAQSDSLIRRLQSQAGIPGLNSIPGSKSSKEPGPLFRVHGNLTANFLPVGKLLYGKLVNRLVVGAEGSPALIELDDHQGGYSRLRIMGTARQAETAGRLSIDASRLLLKSGRAVPMQATALDPDGAFGLEAQVLSGKALAVAGGMASSFIAGLAASQQLQTTNSFGFSQTQPGGRNALLQGVAQTAADQSKRLIDQATAEKPILIVESQSSVTVLIQEEVRF